MPPSRAILVTGASRGIGAEIAREFARSGDRVAVHHRDSPDAANSVLGSMVGDGHFTVAGDLRDAATARLVVEAAAERFGGLDVLVNNAGVYIPHSISDSSYVDWQRAWDETLGVNLIAAANASWCAAPFLKASGRGRIINISSKSAYDGDPLAPAYGAAKAGLLGLSHGLSRSLGSWGVSVTSVTPGWVRTDMATNALDEAELEEVEGRSPFGRMATPQDVAQLVHFLAAESAQFVSGAIVDVNGASYFHL